MRANDPFRNPILFDAISFFSSPKAKVKKEKSKPEKMPAAPNIVIPDPPEATPAPPPPPEATNADVQQAKDDQRLQAANRKGVRATLIAGETGGFTPAADTGKKDILG